MTEWREFRPQQKLLNSNFDGYRLTLEPLAQYTLKFDDNIHVQKESELNQDSYTYNGIKGFKSLNQLIRNPWLSTDEIFFFDQMHCIQHISLSSGESLSRLPQPHAVYQLSKNALNGSMVFLSDSLVLVCDGRSKLLILNITSSKWKLLHEEEFDTFVVPPIRLLHAVRHEGYIQAIIGSLQTDCQLLWATFSVTSTNEIKFARRRLFQGKRWPDFVAIESSGEGVYIASEGLFKLTFDSLIEVKPDDIPKQLVLNTIESSLRYVWSQTHGTIELEIDPQLNQSQQWSVNIDSDHLKCSVDDTVLIDAKLFASIDAQESSYVILKDNNNQLVITLQKANAGFFWSDVFREGQAISGDIKMVHLPETNNQDDDDDLKQPYNNQQLEECDQYSNDTDSFLVRFNGDTHRITHQALIPNQILFTKLDPPSLCIRHDVDGLIWQIDSLSSTDQAPWTHEATLNAFGYVQASKQNRKFISTSTDYSYVLISDLQTHLYLYKQNSPASTLAGTSLRNRKTGKLVESLAKQHMISLENREEILGLLTTNERVFILTANQLFIIIV